MHPKLRAPGLIVLALLASACSSGAEDRELAVAWRFEAGDCASNDVATVRVAWGAIGGALTAVDFACDDGGGVLGELDGGGSYGVGAEGLDAGGVARAVHFGTTITVGPEGTVGPPVELTLRPKPADVTVTWSVGGGGSCPSDVVLPFFITFYAPPAPGGTPTEVVRERQESCASGAYTFRDDDGEGVPPGSYLLEIDSRAVTPAVRGTREVTVDAGASLTFDVQL